MGVPVLGVVAGRPAVPVPGPLPAVGALVPAVGVELAPAVGVVDDDALLEGASSAPQATIVAVINITKRDVTYLVMPAA